MGSDAERKPRLTRETRNVIISLLLSAGVSFGVASYTVQHSEQSQRRDAERNRLSAVYLPLGHAAAAVVACVSPNLCPDADLLRADRAFNTAEVLTLGQGSLAVIDAGSALDADLGRAVRRRLAGKPQPDALSVRIAHEFERLQNLIKTELSR